MAVGGLAEKMVTPAGNSSGWSCCNRSSPWWIEFSALTEPLRVEVVAVVPLAALVVAVGAPAVVKLSTAP